MPALNFQKQFVEKIRSGAKCQTIRAKRKDGRPPCKPGDTLKLYTGMRTKGCTLIRTVKVIGCQPVTLMDSCIYGTGVAGRIAGLEPLDAFARLDGFWDWDELRDWFGKTHGLPFEGWLIRWKNPEQQESTCAICKEPIGPRDRTFEHEGEPAHQVCPVQRRRH